MELTKDFLETFVCGWKQITQQSIEDFELIVERKDIYYDIKVVHKTIDFHYLPSCVIYDFHKPHEVSKILIDFLELIYQKCDDWIEQERESFDDNVDYLNDKQRER